MKTEQLHALLENPEFVGENLIAAHSDHFFYESESDIALKEAMPLKQSLNGVWKFKYSRNLWERPADFYKNDFDVSEFDDVIVPRHIELQGYDRCHYANVQYPWEGTEEIVPPHISKDNAPVGSYVTFFTVAGALKNKPLFISFQGVEIAFRVFVNGEYVGYSEDSYTPAEFEITKFVNEGENRLAVEVYKRTSASWLEDQDMWRFFGIFREVYLYAIPALHVEDMFVKAGLCENYSKGTLKLDAKLVGTPARVNVEVADSNGKKILDTDAVIKDGHAVLAKEGLEVNAWSAEAPNLYELRVLLYDTNGNVIEYAVSRIGFRTFELKDKVMFVNGKRLIFKGVNRHEFSAENGHSVTLEEMLWDIKTFKRNNINAVRTSHYPDQSVWYRLCDEYGIYMIDETNLETHGTWWAREYQAKDYPLPRSKPEWKKAVMERAEHMFMRDKNHPAVLIWSLGNEAFAGSNFVAMHDYFRSVDDTRIVHYEGVANDKGFDGASDVYSRMYMKPEHIRMYLSNNPEKPYMSCEYMHAMGNSLGGMKLYTDLEDEFEMYQGGFIWDYLDQALWQEHDGERRLAYGGDFGDRPTDYCFCTDGIVFANREESPKCKEAKNLYANVHLKADDKEISVENRNLFINLSRYYFVYTVSENGKCIYTKTWTDICTEPGKTETFDVSLEDKLDEKADYVFKLRMCEKEATKWAEAGYEVAFCESTRFAKENPILDGKADAKDEFVHVCHTLINKGVTGKDFKVMFSGGEGGPVSIRRGDEEMIVRTAKPTYFRAYTDNDRGYRLGEKAYFWHMMSVYQKHDFASFEEKDGYVEAVFNYSSPDERAASHVTYKVYTDGHMDVNIHFDGKEGLPELPLFGWELKLDKKYDNVEYFGKGPVESYNDKDNGVYTDIFKTRASDNLTPYLIPQESGNRMGVRWAKVTDDDGHGFLFAAKEGTFEFNFQPYSALELENAGHIDELPKRNYTWIRVIAAQQGVGGDDSWGAPVQKQFRLDSSKDYDLNFEVRFF